MKKALILYYSCSNNTKKMARHFEKELIRQDWIVEQYSLNSFLSLELTFVPDLVIVGVPVHYWDIPEPALKKIRDLPQFQSAYGFVFSTFGKCVCNEVPFFLAKELEKKSVTMLGGAQILMPHATRTSDGARIGDMEEDFGKGEPTQETLVAINRSFHALCDTIEQKSTRTFDILKLKSLHTRGKRAGIMKHIMNTSSRRSVMPDIEHDPEKCTACRACVSNCTIQAIDLGEDKKIVVNKNDCKKCYHCMEICPSGALSINFDKAVFWTRSIHPMAKNTRTRIII